MRSVLGDGRPRGAVAVCLGWREDRSTHGVHYFDSHVLRSLDHVRVVYYPSYSSAERRVPATITLEMPKALRVINEALDVHAAGFVVPLPPAANANKFDRAFEALVGAS